MGRYASFWFRGDAASSRLPVKSVLRQLRWFLLAALLPLGSTWAQTLVVETFNAGTAIGRVVSGSTWDGNVTQNAGSITVGGGALDENGWVASSVHFDATGMNYLTITAQRDAGNLAPSFTVQFEDPNLNTTVFSVPTSQFAVGELTVVNLAISGWSAGFDFTQISGWNVGGGSPGIATFHFTIDEILLQAGIVAAPEITSSATSQTVVAGATVSFAVTATGTGPLTYQWFKDGTTAVSDNATATSATLVLSNVATADAGTYTCRVTNAGGTSTSAAATLTVRPQAGVVLSNLTPTYSGNPQPVTVTTTPTGLTVEVTYDGASTPPVNAGSYAVVATVVDTSYVGSASGTLVVGQRTPVITWTPGGPLRDGAALTTAQLDAAADTAGTFVFDPAAGAVLAIGEHTLQAQFTPTDAANFLPVTVTRTLVVEPNVPTITTAPSDRTTILGQNVSLAVVATGVGPLSYAWSKDGTVLPAATTATLQLSAVTLADAADYTVRVANAGGSSAPVTAHLTVRDVAVQHEVVAGSYTVGGTVTINNTVTYGASVSPTQLQWSVLSPDAIDGVKWTFVTSTGDTAATAKPAADQVDLLEWQWATVPASPFSFTYTLTVPAAATGTDTLTAMVNLTAGGLPVDGMVAPDPLRVVSGAVCHSADTDRSFTLSLSELLRVIQLYNTRLGTTRTGRYQAQAGTVDGFDPDPAHAVGETTDLVNFHAADTDHDASINLTELLRVIQLYNTRAGTTRTGAYHVAPGTVDGFDPG